MGMIRASDGRYVDEHALPEGKLKRAQEAYDAAWEDWFSSRTPGRSWPRSRLVACGSG